MTSFYPSRSRKTNSLSSQLVLLIFTVLLSLASESTQDGTVTNTNVSAETRSEKIKIGTSKTNNYHVQQSNYAPTRIAKLVLNLPRVTKSHKRLRKNRPPTEDEFSVKRRILDVFEEAKRELLGDSGTKPESTLHTDHLERILRALNPKYIATERLYRTAFADPSDPDPSSSLPELPEHSDEPELPAQAQPVRSSHKPPVSLSSPGSSALEAAKSAISQLSEKVAAKLPPLALLPLQQVKKTVDRLGNAQHNSPPRVNVPGHLDWSPGAPRLPGWGPENFWSPHAGPTAIEQSMPQAPQTDVRPPYYGQTPGEGHFRPQRLATFSGPPQAGRFKTLRSRFKDQTKELIV